MNDFLKPNRTKIIIFFVIVALSIVVFVRSFILGFAALGKGFEGFNYRFGILDYTTIIFVAALLWPALIGIYFPVPLIGAIFNLLSIPLLLVYWYLLSCVIYKIIPVVKKLFLRKN